MINLSSFLTVYYFSFSKLKYYIFSVLLCLKLKYKQLFLYQSGSLFEINLQLFDAEDEGRTEPATDRRRREEREKGNVARSPELPASFVLIGAVIILYFMGSYFYENIFIIVKKYFVGLHQKTDLTEANVKIVFFTFLQDCFILLSPILFIVFFFAIIGNLLQVGLLFAPKAIGVDFKKIIPNFKKVLPSRETLFNLFKSIFKLIVITIVSYFVIRQDFVDLLMSGDFTILQAMKVIVYSSFKIFFIIGLLLLVISIADYFYQRYEYEESLKMTPQDTKREAKEQEGDKNLLSRRRQISKDIVSKQKMLKKVPEADVVITNPTHFAVALSYEPGFHNAPEVVAKGVDDFALYIIRIAKSNGIQTVEDRPLARSLYDSVKVGEQIPAEFYGAVSIILRSIDSFNQKLAQRGMY